MTRIINPNSEGKVRARLTRHLALCARELAKRQQIDAETRDLLAYMVLALETIAAGIDDSVKAWEKRGYWVKADRFRLEWEWAGQTAGHLRKALLAKDWAAIPPLVALVAQKVRDVNIAKKHRMGTPWKGAWKKFMEQVG